jgi:hypothetical protein
VEIQARAWDSIADHRNNFAHVGMRPADVRLAGMPGLLADLITRCEALLQDQAAWQIAHAGHGGTLLVTPLGHSPGVLFTALKGLRPARTLVLTSTDAKERLPEAVARAGADIATVKDLVAHDPFKGYAEASRLVTEAHPFLMEAREVVLNVTGGTTVLQYVAERLAREATRLGVPVRRVALVDRRSPEEQKADPYVLGELLDLDADDARLDDASG